MGYVMIERPTFEIISLVLLSHPRLSFYTMQVFYWNPTGSSTRKYMFRNTVQFIAHCGIWSSTVNRYNSSTTSTVVVAEAITSATSARTARIFRRCGAVVLEHRANSPERHELLCQSVFASVPVCGYELVSVTLFVWYCWSCCSLLL